MKIAGQIVEAIKSLEVPIPRLNSEGEEIFIVFKLKPIFSFKEFEDKYPRPAPPIKKTSAGEFPDESSPEYLKQVADWGELKMAWMFLQATKETDIEWDTVTDNPLTWTGFREELKAGGFSNTEIDTLQMKIIEISGMSPANLEAARKRFLALQQGKAKV